MSFWRRFFFMYVFGSIFSVCVRFGGVFLFGGGVFEGLLSLFFLSYALYFVHFWKNFFLEEWWIFCLVFWYTFCTCFPPHKGTPWLDLFLSLSPLFWRIPVPKQHSTKLKDVFYDGSPKNSLEISGWISHFISCILMQRWCLKHDSPS